MRELGDAHTIRQIAVVADAMEAVGQDVEQEAADELVVGLQPTGLSRRVEGHDLSLVVVAIVLSLDFSNAVSFGSETERQGSIFGVGSGLHERD